MKYDLQVHCISMSKKSKKRKKRESLRKKKVHSAYVSLSEPREIKWKGAKNTTHPSNKTLLNENKMAMKMKREQKHWDGNKRRICDGDSVP